MCKREKNQGMKNNIKFFSGRFTKDGKYLEMEKYATSGRKRNET